MNCKKLEENLWLYLYEEMTAEDLAAVGEHLAACVSCRAKADEAERLRVLLAQRESPVEEPELLVEARQALETVLDREEMSWRGWFRSLSSSFPILYASRAAAVLMVLVLGFGLGWLLRPRVSPPDADDRAGGPVDQPFSSNSANDWQSFQIQEIHRPFPDSDTGEVQVTVDAQRRVTLSGTLDNPAIQEVLLHALRSYENPGIRRDTLELLGPRSSDQKVREVFLYALLNDPNDGVRMRALEAVQNFGWSVDVRDTLLEVLQRDSNPGVRVAAVDALLRKADSQALPVLREVASRDANTYVRLRCANAVRELSGEEF